MAGKPLAAPPSWPLYLLRLIVLALSFSASAAFGGRNDIAIASGAGSFTFVDEKGDASKHLTVYTYLPANLPASAAPIVFVMHGHGKNAERYRDTWIAHADKYRFMVIAPRFDREQWDEGSYAYASVRDSRGNVRDPSLWSFSVIEHLFDAVKEATRNGHGRYYLYGHSEGGQFVHRLVLLLPGARYARAVAANPGWYTMPAFDTPFPYGLRGLPVGKESLRQSLARDFVLLLGDRDIDPQHKDLRKTDKAMAQGANRFERGQNFMRQARARAAQLSVPLGWQAKVVPGAAHQNRKMSRAAAQVLLAR